MDLMVIDFTAVQSQNCGSGVKESLGDPLREKQLSKSPLLFSQNLNCRWRSGVSPPSHPVFPPPWASRCQRNTPKNVPRVNYSINTMDTGLERECCPSAVYR